MAIDRSEVRRIAALARIEISEETEVLMVEQLSAVLDYVRILEKLDLEGLEPAALAPADAPLREDRADGRGLDAEEALAAAPQRDGRFFLVPPIVENVNP